MNPIYKIALSTLVLCVMLAGVVLLPDSAIRTSLLILMIISCFAVKALHVRWLFFSARA